MPIPVSGQVGPGIASDGVNLLPFRQGKTLEMMVSELHGRFYEQTLRGNVYSIGSGVTALSANTITLTATSTPIVGAWNPPTSGVNLVILQASAQIFPNTLTSGAGPGPLLWAASAGNTAISTGSAPFSRKTLLSSGSQAKGFPGGVALTGLTNNLAVFAAAQMQNLTNLTYTTLGSTALLSSVGGVENFDGSLIVPPGGVLSLVNTTSSTTFSAAVDLIWEEVPV